VLSGVLGAPHSNRWEHRWRRFAKGFHSGRMSSNRGTRALRGQSAVSSTLSKDNRRGRPSSASSGKGSRKGGGANSSSIALPGQLPSFKAGRVKVGIRCRPAFQDEIDFAQGNYMSIVETKPERPDNNLLGLVYLTLMSGKQREFQYDYVFGARDSQDSVYDRIARPVVTDVLKGFNGTIFAYVSPLYSLLLDMFSCVSM
jgi:hypothetical protein